MPLVPRTPVEVLSACGCSRSTAPKAHVTVMEPRLFVCRVSTALLALSCPATAGGAAGPPNPVAIVFEVFSAGGDSRSSAPEASANICIGSSAPDRIKAPVDHCL